jgi:hypothetical protein
MNERKEMLALNRHRYDELVQITDKALTVRLFICIQKVNDYSLLVLVS